MVTFFKSLFQHFSNSNSSQKSSSLAYYTLFSILPMIMIIISILGIFLGKQAVSNEVFLELKSVIGVEAAEQLQSIVKNQHLKHKSVLTALIGFVTLALGASGMLSQIHSSFNEIWGINTKTKNGIVLYVLTHLKSLFVLMVLCSIMFFSTFLNALLVKLSATTQLNHNLTFVYEHLVAFSLLTVIFGVMFKFLGDAKVHWKAAILGGVFTAILFTIGKTAIAMYIGHSSVSTTFGTASFVVLILLWAYYISQIVFLGASFVYVISEKLSCKILPKE